MTERDRVLDAFRNCITEPKYKDCPWTECETIDNGTIEIPRDLALAVMRELVVQEPVKPAVDAIPVEWIQKQRNLYLSVIDERNLFHAAILNDLVIDWRKEQKA